MKAHVILNEQHTLLPDQERVLNEKFGEGEWATFFVPSNGWTLEEQQRISEKYRRSDVPAVVFASPVPFLLMELARTEGVASLADRHNLGRTIDTPTVYVFHNDRREKKELPNGKIIHTVAQEGWEIV